MKRFNSENIKSQFQNLIVRFPVSIVFIILLGLWNFSLVENTFELLPIETVLATGIILATAVQLAYERFFRDTRKAHFRWLLYAGVALFLIVYHYYFLMSIDNIDGSWTIYSIPGIRAMIVYFISVLLLIWIPSVKSKIKFSDSFLVIFKGYFTSSFFAIVLFIGIISTLFLFERLFFTLETNWFSYAFIFAFNLFLPSFFLTFIPDYQETDSTEEETGTRTLSDAIKMPSFLHKLVTYILIPLLGVYTFLLVFYIVTNLPTVFFEDNLIEVLVLTYAINGWILLILSDPIENKLSRIFKKVFPFLLIFVLIFQMIATFLEIQEIGMTHGRYFILIFGAGSIISALWYILKDSSLMLLPIVSLTAAVIALVPPFDAVGLSVRNQVNRVENLLEQHDILHNQETIIPNPDVLPADQERINASISYLRGINALNQLTWLPQNSHHYTDELFGFREELYIEEENEALINAEYYDVRLIDGDNFSLPVGRYDYMLNLVLENNEQTVESVIVQDEKVNIHFNLEDNFIIRVESESSDQEVAFDFSYIFDTFEKEDAYLPVEQMMFTEESDDFIVTVFVKSLEVYRNGLTIEFVLFL